MEQALVWTTELRVRVGPKVMQEGRIQGQGGTQGHAGAQNPGLDAVRTANYWRGGGCVCAKAGSSSLVILILDPQESFELSARFAHSVEV